MGLNVLEDDSVVILSGVPVHGEHTRDWVRREAGTRRGWLVFAATAFRGPAGAARGDEAEGATAMSIISNWESAGTTDGHAPGAICTLRRLPPTSTAR
jgi:hypothetical protein